MNKLKKLFFVFPLLFLASYAVPTYAKGNLTVYCSVEIEVCEILIQGFKKDTGIDVAMTRKSSGETFAQMKAEANNPKGDVWYGGTGDPHLTAASVGLTEKYKSKHFNDLLTAAQNQAKFSDYRSVGIYVGALGYGYKTNLLKEKGLPVPKSWADLTNPVYKGEVQMANPNSSGTAYTTLATIIQILGDDKGWDFMKALHKNINQYTKSGSAPIKAAAKGETTIGIVFQHDATKQKKSGLPIAVVSPTEGTGFEVGSMSIIKGARNMKEAKIFADWALSPAAQTLVFSSGISLQVPANAKAKGDPDAPVLSKIKLISYDFEKYGNKDTRSQLLRKWDKDVSNLPK